MARRPAHFYCDHFLSIRLGVFVLSFINTMKQPLFIFQILSLAALTLSGFTLSSAEGLAHQVPRLLLWPEGSIAAGVETERDPAIPTMDVHLPAPGKATGTGVIVLPGGSYGGVSMEFEGVHAAKFLTDHGIAAFVVRYRHAPRFHHPVPLQDAQRAMQLVRARAAEFQVSPQRLGLMGFSAGGHLASTVITQLELGQAAAVDPLARVSARPDFAILIYPVITFSDTAFVHQGSRTNLTAGRAELWPELSNERHVSAATPPVFLVHGGMDTSVPPENSMLFAAACRRAGVSVELHVLSQGEHAFRDAAIRGEAYEYLQHWLNRNGWLNAAVR